MSMYWGCPEVGGEFRWSDLRKRIERMRPWTPMPPPPKPSSELDRIRQILDPKARAEAFAKWKAELYAAARGVGS